MYAWNINMEISGNHSRFLLMQKARTSKFQVCKTGHHNTHTHLAIIGHILFLLKMFFIDFECQKSNL